jgi:hypothetical protein
MSEHITTIVEDWGTADHDEIPTYCYSCSCGYAGVAWHVRPNAEQDAERHRRRHTTDNVVR